MAKEKRKATNKKEFLEEFLESNTLDNAKLIVAKEKIRELKEENKSLKKDILKYSKAIEENKVWKPAFKFIQDLLREVIASREGYFRTERTILAKEKDGEVKNRLLRSIKDIICELETILFNYDVEMFKTKLKNKPKFNLKEQQIINVIPTEDEQLNGVVAESLGDLYKYKDEVLFKEKVNVYKYSKKNIKGEKENE